MSISDSLQKFSEYVASLDGDEKGEAQVFLERLFIAFGHQGYHAAGAKMEARVRKGAGKAVSFADLVWKPRVVIEMKKRGEKLIRHTHQAFEYWKYLVPNRPRYVILCNFDEMWIYDFDEQLEEPMDKVRITDLPTRYPALNFMFPKELQPLWGYDRIEVTKDAAAHVTKVFDSLLKRNIPRERAQRYILQCVVAMFAEDIGLLEPKGIFTSLVTECIAGADPVDRIGGLFEQMNNPVPAKSGRYRDVEYFNGGLFKDVDPIALTKTELKDLREAGNRQWAKVNPAIFGTLFQTSMGDVEQHTLGAHYTYEADIQRVVYPTLVKPFRDRIAAATTATELLAIGKEIMQLRVLDPACGSGNFLYVAFRELRRLEVELLMKIREEYGAKTVAKFGTAVVSTAQFHGIDAKPFAVELAKVTLMIGKKLASDEAKELLAEDPNVMPFLVGKTLPLDNLDANFIRGDALFVKWPAAQVIIGNPPYQSKNKMPQEYGAEYVAKVRAAFPDASGRSDYCVYWFRRAHDHLPPNGRAGLVGTKSIRQTYSRKSSLDYIDDNGGVIVDAVGKMKWSGTAIVQVSIVNWIKGKHDGKKTLSWREGRDADGEWQTVQLDRIPTTLSTDPDITDAEVLKINTSGVFCRQGQTHGQKGFLLSPAEHALMTAKSKAVLPYLHPFLTGDDMLTDGRPSRYVIDLNACDDLGAASAAGPAFVHVKAKVLPEVLKLAAVEKTKTKKDKGPRQTHATRWWKFWRERGELMTKLSGLTRYIACSRVTRHPIFEFVCPDVHPNDALQVFCFEDDYSFGVLQSRWHVQWFEGLCSGIRGDPRYTDETVFATFPWPQAPTLDQALAVAKAARLVRAERAKAMKATRKGLRHTYSVIADPGVSRLRAAHTALDAAVRAAYGIAPKISDRAVLMALLELNLTLHAAEEEGKALTPPGLPPCVKVPKPFISNDCIKFP